MSTLTLFGACAVSIKLHTSALEQRSAWWVLMFAFTWLFGVVEGVRALVAFSTLVDGAPIATKRTSVTLAWIIGQEIQAAS